MNNKIIVKQNKVGSILYCLSSIIMCLLSLVCLLEDLNNIEGISSFFIFNNFLKVVFIVGILLFGYTSIFLFRRLKSGVDILIADEDGITDNSSLVAFGFIPWKDIKRVSVGDVFGQRFIELELEIASEMKYIEKLSFLKQKIARTNKKRAINLYILP